MLIIKHISKSFGTKKVLKDIMLTFEPGKVYGIIGENGAGKTTLFRCIAGLETYEGEITSEFDVLKNHLGYLQTEPYFFNKITGKEYLQLFCIARKISNVDIDANNVFELPLNQYAQTYSTGMKKKLALMAILLQKNEIIILDEPFNGVDFHSNLLIEEIINKLKKSNKSVIISSHIFSTLTKTCDEIHLLENGCISESVHTSKFDELEKKIKKYTIGNRVELLNV
jgi:ABC-2 type transport system ATP-binding protein